MKKTIRGLLVTALVVVGGMVMSAGYAQCADEPLLPEVKKLIGMKIPPASTGKRGKIPEWDILWGNMVDDRKGFEVIQRGAVIVLLIGQFVDQTATVLDARVIPGEQLRFYLENGKLQWRKNEAQWYRITKDCSREGAGKQETIIGMWKFEPDSKCTDPSTFVKKAWLLDLQSGRLTDIPTQGVSCREPDCGDE